MKYRLYIFDLDGTIMDSRHSILSSMKDVAIAKDLPEWSESKGRLYIGHTLEDILKSMGCSDVAGCRDIYRESYYKYIDSEKPYAGMPEVLESLKKRAFLSICTNKGYGGTKRTLTQSGLWDYFDAIATADKVIPKPKPDSFEGILKYYRDKGEEINREECLMVGDSSTDIQYAHNCGIDSAFVKWGFFNREQLTAEPTYEVSNPSDLLQLG